MTSVQTIVGGGGTSLAVRRTGPSDAPAVVLLHGWAQSGAAWAPQFADPGLTEHYQLLAVDLRGHGLSEAPADGYADPAAWAADVAAVLAELDRPAVVVGWSYGGVVLADYLRVHGADGLAGIALVGAVTELGRGRAGGRIGPVMRAALPAALSDDVAVAVPALTDFVAGITAEPLPGADVQRLLGAALATPPAVRAALFAREVDSTDLLAALDLPALVVHGTKDGVVDPAVGEHHAKTIPNAEYVALRGLGHTPFAEDADMFDAVLTAFLARCFEPSGKADS